MSNADRAKIFIPFNPLKGLTEALRAKEREAEAEAKTGDGVSRREGSQRPN